MRQIQSEGLSDWSHIDNKGKLPALPIFWPTACCYSSLASTMKWVENLGVENPLSGLKTW